MFYVKQNIDSLQQCLWYGEISCSKDQNEGQDQIVIRESNFFWKEETETCLKFTHSNYLCFGSLSLGFVLFDRLFFLDNCSWFVLIKRGDSSAELLLLRKVKVPITYRCSVLNSPTRRSVQPLFGGTRSQFGRESCLKVKFCC